jgi:histidinol-phosphate/aromatic aminotransferase/cobyric acid decarboxylase-like protein/choline kinase
LQAVILAAGLGRRLGELTRERTKAMLEVGDRTLIARALDALGAAGVARAVVVPGHAGAALQRALGAGHAGVAIEYVENPAYAETNNIYSLWLAREVLERDDSLILESDIVFEPDLIKDVLADASANLAVVAKFEPWMDGTVTLLDADDNVVSLVPRSAFDWSAASRYYKTVNIYKFSRGFARELYLPFLEAYIRAFGRSRFYEQVLAVVTYLAKSELRAHRTARRWYEIDDVEDLRTAETLFADAGQRLAAYAGRFGGLWRFPRLLDACYLVNPFFPHAAFLDELRARLQALVAAYPSGLEVQCELMSRLFPVRPAQLLVGNGASELIRALRGALPGPWGLPVPSFEEYLAQGTSDLTLAAAAPDFEPDLAALVELGRRAGTLVLVNPNNPTGAALAPVGLARLIEATAALGVRLIVDESFVDFADPGQGESLLSADVLERHPSLVVVRSLGKSHGVAGLRLGVVASADAKLIAALRRRLPIWNVNALAEAFLQAAPRHQDAYRDACRQLVAERRRLGGALSRLRRLRVVPSQANYFLCESERPAAELARALVERHEILVKDCTGKAGLASDRYLRFAVRTPEQNDRLLAALSEALG